MQYRDVYLQHNQERKCNTSALLGGIGSCLCISSGQPFQVGERHLVRLCEWDPVIPKELPFLDVCSKPAAQLGFDCASELFVGLFIEAPNRGH